MKPDKFWLENIEAHTRPSAETGLAPTNWRENKANANFIMRKGLMSWKSRRKRLPVTALRTPFLSFIAKPATVLIVTYRDNINDLWEKADWTQTHWHPIMFFEIPGKPGDPKNYLSVPDIRAMFVFLLCQNRHCRSYSQTPFKSTSAKGIVCNVQSPRGHRFHNLLKLNLERHSKYGKGEVRTGLIEECEWRPRWE